MQTLRLCRASVAMLVVACSAATACLADDASDAQALETTVTEWSDSLTLEVTRNMTAKLSKVRLPDLQVERANLIDSMPQLTGNETRSIEFKNFRDQLGEQGRKIEKYSQDIQEFCAQLDKIDVWLRKAAASDLITGSRYEYDKAEINDIKQSCITNPKDGPYWSLYDEALRLLDRREAAITDARDVCRNEHPKTCIGGEGY